MNISDGSIGYELSAYDSSTVTVSGGTIGDYLYAFDDSEVTIFGTGFNFAYGDYLTGNWTNGTTLTGTLADGTAFDNEVLIYQSATVTLAAPVAAVPEPAIDKQTGNRHRVKFDDGAESNLLSVTSRGAASDRPAVSTRRIARDGSGWTFGQDG